jgi:hypothetical protein
MGNYLGYGPCAVNSIGELAIDLVALLSLNPNKPIYK